jgi:hypothetical protein
MMTAMRRTFVTLVSIFFAVALALVASSSAGAHLTAEPAFLSVGSKQRLVLTVHNDRDAEMTGFRLTVPAGFRILGTGGGETWNEVVEEATASWTGGSLGPFEPTTFEVDVEAAGVEPGPVVLRGDQLYADGETVSWPVALTVVPPGGSAGDDDAAVGGTAVVILSVLGALVVGTFLLVFWQRRRGSLQEK